MNFKVFSHLPHHEVILNNDWLLLKIITNITFIVTYIMIRY